ncbi:RTA1 like protein-domain-containing protein [Aspergillus bertholletiae]|uniref:RTA1 like protein-domain-containing protein n=1 Tax=Aspergillus bertholletiae TaxID=1226010 RepID=A0A5N7B340_9EURO|nr:RTA1 like protein-domain-containing protein [Aspergillus bertholletiae]
MAPMKQYPYDPSKVAPIIFAVLYSISAIVTTVQYFWWRCWYWLPMVVASLMEAGGYISRSYSSYHEYNAGSFDVQYLLLFLAPTVMAVACYMTLSRIITRACRLKCINMRTLWVTPRYMTPIFVTCDILALVIQLIGGVCAISKTSSTIRIGYNIAKAGLLVQIVSFGIFIVISLRFHFISRNPTIVPLAHRWTTLLLCINVSCMFIFARSVYRLVEFCQGADGYLNLHEWNSYVFDATIILPAAVIFNIVHPAKYMTNTYGKQSTPAQSAASEDGLVLERRF